MYIFKDVLITVLFWVDKKGKVLPLRYKRKPNLDTYGNHLHSRKRKVYFLL